MHDAGHCQKAGPVCAIAACFLCEIAVYNRLMPAFGEKSSSFKGEALPLPPLRSDVAVSLRMLVLIRWVAVIGQAATLLVVHYVLGFDLPLTAALGVVAISALLNVVAWISNRAAARLGNREAAIYLAFDTLQLGVLLFLTGRRRFRRRS